MTLKLFLVLSVLAIFSTLSFATINLDDFFFSLPLIIIIVVISFALLYMLSQMINSPALNAWVKTEIRELIIGAILFGIVYVLFFSPSVLGTGKDIFGIIIGKPNYGSDASAFLSTMINTYAKQAYIDDLKASYLIGLQSAYSTSLAASLFIIGFNTGGTPYSGYSAFSTFLSQATYGLTNVIFIYSALAVLLDFFLFSIPKLIFVAFAFRFIPFTRQMGNTLIAIMLAAYVVFPFSILLVQELHTLISPFPTPTITRFNEFEFGLPAGMSFVCSKTTGIPIRFMLAFFGEIGFSLGPCIIVGIATLGYGFWPCFLNLADWVFPLVTSIASLYFNAQVALSTFSVSDNSDVIFAILKPFLMAVNNLVVITYLDLIIISTLTYISAKSFSAALGGEYFLPAVSRLV
ncbi:MAG: hypothetical protein AABX38_05900 [Candidatus Micrarchaeota archaeon]